MTSPDGLPHPAPGSVCVCGGMGGGGGGGLLGDFLVVSLGER